MDVHDDDLIYSSKLLKRRLFHYPEIISVGVGVNNAREKLQPSFAHIITVKNKAKKYLKASLPLYFKGIPVIFQEGLEFKLLHNSLLSGVGISHYKGGSGTLGAYVKKDNIEYILSNNHVLANCNLGKAGDEIILKTSKKEKGEKVGELHDFIQVYIENNNSFLSKLKEKLKLYKDNSKKTDNPKYLNYVDAALATPINTGNLNIPVIGLINNIKKAKVGLKVKKYGNATGFTEGRIVQTGVTCKVKFGKKYAVFTDQIMCEMPNKPGDSGALLVSGDNNAVGLVFSGNKNYLLANRIEHVFDALKVTF